MQINDNFCKLPGSYLFSRSPAVWRATPGAPGGGADPPGHRGCDPAAASGGSGGDARRRGRTGERGDLPGLWPRTGLSVPAGGHGQV